jgi:cytochrome c oxidase accessory protein FixG
MSKHDAPNLTRLSVINEDGSRNHVHPADVKGRFTTLKPFIRWGLIVLWAVLPWIQIGNHPAVFLNIAERKFFLFGFVFNAQDAPLLFFMMTGGGFALIVATALFGRVWCGWACPQTVFLDGVYRQIERLIDGPRNERIRLAASPWTTEKIVKRVVKQTLFVALSFGIAHIFLAYFVSLGGLYEMMTSRPSENWGTFLWMAAITGILYFNFAWFREQLCLIICPYGRLQSALQDDDTVVIGYDAKRGEPRGKAKDDNAGDCVDCGRCIAVCPTGIDIRNGLQMECIGCAACIDACDDVMAKLKRPRGLVRYDTFRGFETGKRRILRPRLAYYAVAGLVGLGVATVMFSRHEPFEANLLRVVSEPFVVESGTLSNRGMIHIIHKDSERTAYEVRPVFQQDVNIILPQPRVELGELGSHQVPVIVQIPTEKWTPERVVIFRVVNTVTQHERQVTMPILGPPSLMKGRTAPAEPPAPSTSDGAAP